MSQYVEAVFHKEHCALRICDEPWPYAREKAADIASAWHARLAANPAFFNGIVHLLRIETPSFQPFQDGARTFEGAMWRSDFKSFIHWRANGYPPADALDCFGSVILRSAEGHVLLATQREGINAGTTYFPGGFIDDRDACPGGAVNLDGSVARELAEETGLDAGAFNRTPGYLLTRCGPILSIGIEYQSALEADALREAISRHLSAEADPELSDVVFAKSMDDLTGLKVPRYTALAVAYLFADRSS